MVDNIVEGGRSAESAVGSTYLTSCKIDEVRFLNIY